MIALNRLSVVFLSALTGLALASTLSCGGSSEELPEQKSGESVEHLTGPDATGTGPLGPPSLGVRGCGGAQIGRGPSDWRQTSEVAGRVAVFREPLAIAFEHRPGVWVNKVPVLVVGHREIILKVPRNLIDRVRLFYTAENNVVTRGDGDSAVRFEPCPDKPRTIFPGGVRVIGDGTVSLKVIDEGSPTRVLPLGRPGSTDRAD